MQRRRSKREVPVSKQTTHWGTALASGKHMSVQPTCDEVTLLGDRVGGHLEHAVETVDIIRGEGRGAIVDTAQTAWQDTHGGRIDGAPHHGDVLPEVLHGSPDLAVIAVAVWAAVGGVDEHGGASR